MRTPRFHLRTILIAIALFTVFLHYIAIPTWDYFRLPPKTRFVLSRLDRPIQMPSAGPMPLSALLKSIRAGSKGPKDNGIPIYVDPNGLSEAGAQIRSPVRIDSNRVPIKDVLQQTLKQLQLGYFVEDGLLTITSEKAAERMLRDKPKSARRP